MDPTASFETVDCKGPKFRAAHTGTVIQETNYVAALFMKECAAWDSEGKVVPGRVTQPVGITIANLGRAPAPEMHPARSSAFMLLFASLHRCFILGPLAVEFIFTYPESAQESPAGDGIFTSSSGKDIVLLRGREGAVNSITCGTFSLRFSSEAHFTPSLIRWCTILFFIRGIAQLLLTGIPQASLLAKSCSLPRWEKIHREFIFERVFENPMLIKYMLGTCTTAAVFMLLALQPQDPTALLNELLPNDTEVWKQWKMTNLGELLQSHVESESHVESFLSESKIGDLGRFKQQDQELLYQLYEDARAAYKGYRDSLRVDSDFTALYSFRNTFVLNPSEVTGSARTSVLLRIPDIIPAGRS
ncbi:hypothetical protein OG21DRAFT_1607686 [Imleria badia]|nr:hypothetical protein OG21DRAFT_1607686 [Imleria badia]